MNFPSMMGWDLSELQKFRSQLDAFRQKPLSSNDQASGLAIGQWRQIRKPAEHEHDVKNYFLKKQNDTLFKLLFKGFPKRILLPLSDSWLTTIGRLGSFGQTIFLCKNMASTISPTIRTIRQYEISQYEI